MIITIKKSLSHKTQHGLFLFIIKLPRFSNLAYSIFCTLQGTPYATAFAGISFVTTLPAPMVVLSPIVTPGNTITPAPSQTPFPDRDDGDTAQNENEIQYDQIEHF